MKQSIASFYLLIATALSIISCDKKGDPTDPTYPTVPRIEINLLVGQTQSFVMPKEGIEILQNTAPNHTLNRTDRTVKGEWEGRDSLLIRNSLKEVISIIRIHVKAPRIEYTLNRTDSVPYTFPPNSTIQLSSKKQYINYFSYNNTSAHLKGECAGSDSIRILNANGQLIQMLKVNTIALFDTYRIPYLKFDGVKREQIKAYEKRALIKEENEFIHYRGENEKINQATYVFEGLYYKYSYFMIYTQWSDDLTFYLEDHFIYLGKNNEGDDIYIDPSEQALTFVYTQEFDTDKNTKELLFVVQNQPNLTSEINAPSRANILQNSRAIKQRRNPLFNQFI